MGRIFILFFLAWLSCVNCQKGGWSMWSEWSSWGKGLCSGNQRLKSRTCTNPLPQSGTEYCDGEPVEQQKGPVDGGLSEWSQWSMCEKPCGGSIVNRTRLCNDPPPSNGGASCFGKTFETKMECVMPCPEKKTDGQWSPWSDWTICPKTCTKNGGIKIERYRQCNMPPPMFGGADCQGSTMEETIGCFNVCPVHGGFNQWSAFTECSKTCGNGLKSRYRLCNAPEPRGEFGRNCTGDFKEIKHCRLATCEGAINGNWAAWGQWTQCTENKECLKGIRKRVRTCTNPAPSKGGDDCLGSADESDICPKINCKDTHPIQSPSLPVYPTDYIYRECGGVTTKYIGSTIPQHVLDIVNFQKNKFISGYFAQQDEEEGSVTKYCFEPFPPLTIREVAKKIPSYSKTSVIPNYEKPSDDNFILGFSVRVVKETKTLKGWDFGLSEAFEYNAGKYATMHDVMFTYYSEGSHFGFLAKGKYKVFNAVTFDAVVFNNATLFHSTISGKAEKIQLKSIFKAIGIPEISILKKIKVWDAEFSPVTITYSFNLNFVLAITASKKIGGVPVHFEMLAVHSIKSSPKVAFGFSFDGESYGALLDKMAGAGSAGSAVSSFLNSLGLEPEVGVMYCPPALGELTTSLASTFKKSPLKDIFKVSAPVGLHAVAQLGVPKDCRQSSMCTILKKLIGPEAKFRMAGTVATGYYKVSAGFYKIRLYKEFYMDKLELKCEFNATTTKATKLAFVIEFKIPVASGDIMVDGVKVPSSLSFGGTINHEIGTTKVSGSLYMRGLWRKAFGLKFINFGNINLGLTLDSASPTVVTGFQLGATIEFGTDCFYEDDFSEQGHCLRFAVYFGIGDPQYFYGRLSSLTIGKVVRMVGSKGGLPKPVAESGFKKDLIVSYNGGDTVDLRIAGGPLIASGFQLKGLLNLFGYEIKAWIRYSTTELYLDGELDPINLGGHVIMSRNATAVTVGPKLFLHAKQNTFTPYFKMYFEGYVKILGIEASAYLNITMEAMEIYIYGKVWNLIYCELYVAAGYDYTKISDAHFYIRVLVDLRGLTDAIENARKSVDKAFKDAQKQLRNAIEHVQEKKRECKEKLKLKCSNCYNLKCKKAQEDCKGFLNAAGKWIANTAKKVWNKINPANWGWGRRRRRSLLSQRDRYFDLHVRRKRFISKLICEGVVGGSCKGIAHLCYGSCKVVDFIGQGLCHTLDIAVGALKVAEKACGWINSAVQFLLQMFLIHGIRFELGLGQKFNGFMVAAEIDMTLFGNRMYFGFAFDLKNPYRSIKSAGDGSLYRYKQGVRQLRTELTYNPYDRPNPFSDFDIPGTFGIEALQTGTENRLGGCIAALSNGDNSALKILPCYEKDERTRWTYTIDGKLINLHSKKCMEFGGSAGSDLRQVDCQNGNKERMEHECDVVTRTLKLRRNDLCVTMSKASNLGPGFLAHHSSGKCIHLNPANRLVLRTGCYRADTVFQMNEKGHIVFIWRKRCVRVVNGYARQGSKLELTHNMADCHQFEFTTRGSIRHVKSRLCLQTPNMETKPNDYTELILGQACEYKSGYYSGGGQPADPELTFTFLPQDNSVRMQKCGSFYDTMMEQRFAVMHEELNSVCTKYAKNLAQNQMASQSSIKYNGFPSRAIDGNFNFQWEKGSCMHTNEEQDPWWRVDLGREYIITDVTIINRGEHGYRFKNIQVHIGQHLDIKRNPVCHERIRQASDGDAIRLTCDPPIPGQFVGLQMYGRGILSMCEVVVASRLGGFGDWCRIENGGCEQICYNDKCGHTTTCGCLPGYQLAYDGRSCIDINECLSNHGGCRLDKQAHCVNYPGGFFCGCNKGYILKDNSLNECVDLNECGWGNGGCEQMCNNKLGGYLCTCRKGFERKPNNPFGCQDINECLTKNGECDHKCHNFEGGHYCSCHAGYRLREDGKSCEELFCPVLEAPYHGHVTPSACAKKYENIKVGSICKFECSKGYELKTNVGATSLNCRIDGTWNHATPNCHPVKCPTLQRPANGGLVPARCHDDKRGFNEFGQRCVGFCKHGYRLRGAPTKYCQADKTWSNTSSLMECVKIIEPPYLNCPADVEATLPNDSNEMQLGKLFELPQTNMNFSKILSYPKNIGPYYKFKFGKTLISYVGTDESGQQLSCSYFIDIKDKTPPEMSGCPSDITKTTNKFDEIISWVEPKFTDNVGIRHLMKPVRKPGQLWMVGEEMEIFYMATDVSGNQRKCSFKVALKSTLCPALVSKNLDHFIQVISPRQTYTAFCKNGKTLFGNFDKRGVYIRCKGGSYHIGMTDIGKSVPDCVPQSPIVGNGYCPEGYERMSYDDWFVGKVFFCAACPSGTFWSSSTKTCSKCIVGEYQDDHGMLTCETCPLGTSTLKIGSKSLQDCIAQCPAGTFSPSGLDATGQQCTLCPKGSYSYLNGSKICTVCPGKSTTSNEGSTKEADCHDSTRIIDITPNGPVTGRRNFKLNLNCYFEAKPSPKATWSKQEGPLPSEAVVEDMFDFNMKYIGVSMMIPSASVSDAGTYICSIKNSVGSDTKSVVVKIL